MLISLFSSHYCYSISHATAPIIKTGLITEKKGEENGLLFSLVLVRDTSMIRNEYCNFKWIMSMRSKYFPSYGASTFLRKMIFRYNHSIRKEVTQSFSFSFAIIASLAAPTLAFALPFASWTPQAVCFHLLSLIKIIISHPHLTLVSNAQLPQSI